MGAGAMGHMETSLFEQCGYSREAIQARLERNWYEMFEGPDKIYWENDEGLGYVMDTGNHDVRTEGMSYAMMIAVQYGRKDVFDKLWGWVMKYMFMTEGLHQGYFVWSVDPSGVPNADGPAPDGEEYFAMDLFLASARWGDGEGVYEYSRHVRSILHTCVHQGEDGEGYPMWNPENHLIKFIPETEWTDPSYHLPHFYEVFAERADEADRPFWAQAAKASREYLVTACHPQTGMNPEYSNYDGTPHVDERDHWHFYSDAYRTAGNIGLDCLWNGVVPDCATRTRGCSGSSSNTTAPASTRSTARRWTRPCCTRSASSPPPPKARSPRCTRRNRTRSTTRSAGCACCGTPRSAPARAATTTTSSTPSRSWRWRGNTAPGEVPTDLNPSVAGPFRSMGSEQG